MLPLHSHMSLALVTWIQGAAQTGAPQTPPWWQVVTGIIGVPGALVALYVAWLTSHKIRMETRSVQLDILKKEGAISSEAQRIPRSQELISSPQVLAAGIQDFLIRFIIIYLAYNVWGLVISLIAPFVSVLSTAYSEIGMGYSPWFSTLLGTGTALVSWVGNLLIFLVLGLPLLSDIARSLGLRARDLFRRRQHRT
jgi:hypothetical protein